MKRDKESEVLRSTREMGEKFGLAAAIRRLAGKEEIERKRECL